MRIDELDNSAEVISFLKEQGCDVVNPVLDVDLMNGIVYAEIRDEYNNAAQIGITHLVAPPTRHDYWRSMGYLVLD